MANPAKVSKLLDILIDATLASRAAWQSGGDRTYLTSAKEAKVYLVDGSLEENSFYALNIFNNKLDIVDSIEIPFGSEDYQRAEKLYEVARRSALKSEEIVDNLILEFSGTKSTTR